MNKLSAIFVLSQIFAINTPTQITEEIITDKDTVIIQDKPEISSKYIDRFKDADECEDACKEDCHRFCENICGNNDDCEDTCLKKCEDNCEIDCSKLKIAYGPQKGSVLLFISGSYFIFHNSRISEEEDRFLRETGMYMIYTDKNGNAVDTVLLDYLYSSFSGAFGVQYFLSEIIGLGIIYEFIQTSQNINNFYEQSSTSLLNSNTIAALITAYAFQKKRLGLSIGGNIGALCGVLTRFPLMFEDAEKQNYMTQYEEAFVRAFHEKVSVSGITFTINVNIQFMINKFMTANGGPRYTYRYLILSNDQFSGYPRKSNSNDIGIVFNFGFLINSKNSH